jgi:hypothetical protein
LNGASQVQLTHQLGMAANKPNKLQLVPATEVEDSRELVVSRVDLIFGFLSIPNRKTEMKIVFDSALP